MIGFQLTKVCESVKIRNVPMPYQNNVLFCIEFIVSSSTGADVRKIL